MKFQDVLLVLVIAFCLIVVGGLWAQNKPVPLGPASKPGKGYKRVSLVCDGCKKHAETVVPVAETGVEIPCKECGGTLR